jgi:hypothetical protein
MKCLGLLIVDTINGTFDKKGALFQILATVEISSHLPIQNADILANFRLERFLKGPWGVQLLMKKTDTTKAPKSLHRGEIRPLAFYCYYTEKSL